MTDLLTHAEYQAIADSLDPPRSPFIDGKFQRGAGPMMPTTNPATGQEITQISTATTQDVDLAVAKAREAFDQGRWSKLDPAQRKDVLIRLCKLMTRNRRELAVMESVEAGKPILDCETIDIPEAIDCIKWHAEAADKIYDQTAPTGDGAIAMITREPVGVVAAVLPWNFPLLMLAWKIGPALAAGCSVIVKPAEQTSLTALRVAELAYEAGLPRGVFQVLPGDGPSVGEPLGRHMDVDMVTFTGSTDTGRMFLKYAADSNLKKVVLECGGKNPAVVFDDAENLDHVAEHVVNAAFWNGGQNCSAASRLIVHASVKDSLMDKITARLRDWKVGDPLDPTTHIGTLIDADHCAKVRSYLDNVGAGPFVAPQILHVAQDDPRARDEIFGPVLCVIEASSNDEAVQIANDTSYGLAASVFSGEGRAALRAARDIKAGTVTVNCYGEGSIATPFGGYKHSGFGGRDNGLHAHDQYTEIKTIWVDLNDPADGNNVG
ncbi:aldehyde dehydrogenase [Pseudooctadecabacter jejudonensis]|uniref:Aldehyde dehydrogenase PuuC n=1 Tax=Pseudooctadecabacter jejudonensis TaxID=1391910 RepID=A0A1Y5SMZ9_9RHOB|nr:aldehyde dehydrogenase [Pseudooctadecabacter jejudonensis]SLN44442.1 Aldehyde dehydrogenase PuuC [Pseudooctadecabacter jejudonensis]